MVRRHLLGLTVLLTTLVGSAFLTQPAVAAEQVEIRAATHKGYARIAFEWPASVGYETHVEGTVLTVHFARPLIAKLDLLSTGLADYIASATLADDRKSVIIELRRPFDVKAFAAGDKIVAIDLSASAGPSADAKKPEPAPAASSSPEKIAEAAAKADAKPLPVRLRVSKSRDTISITFRWPQKVDYTFVEKDGFARLDFQRAGTIDLARLAAAVPQLAPKIEQQPSGTTLILGVAKGTTATPYRVGDDIVLEIAGKPEGPANAGAPPRLRPPGDIAAAASGKPPADKPTDAAKGKGAAAKAANDKTAEGKPGEAKDTASVVPPPGAAPPAAGVRNGALPATIGVRYLADSDTSSLRFDWPIATAASVYRRGSAVWIVFAAPANLDLTEPRTRGQQMFRSLDQMAVPEATVLRLVTREGINPSVRRSGTSWIIDLKAQSAQSEAPIMIEARPSADPPDVHFRVRQTSSPLRLHDPDTGDTLVVVPVGDLGRGISALQGFIDFRVLPSVQGVVVHPNADDLVVRADVDGIEITRPGGLTLSSERDRLLGRALDTSHRLFDFAAWRGAEDEDFLKRRSLLEQAVAAAPLAARSKPRLDLARFYFASLFDAEAIGVLDAVARDDPETAATPAVRALRGGACLLAHDLHCAADELSLHALDAEPEALLWRGSLAAETGDWDNAASDFVSSVSLLPFYPSALRNRFLLQAAEAMLNTDQAEAAKPLIEFVLAKMPDNGDKAMALYLSGRVEQAAGHLDGALEMWRKVAAMNDRPSRARALYSMALASLDAGKATREETIKALDALRFAWRGDAFEFGLLRRLGDLKLEVGDYRSGLATLREAASNFPDYPASKDITQQIADRFADLFLGNGAEDLPPLKALALYDEFHDVEPPGERSDAIVRKLVDRLVAVDLLDRAGALLDDQVNHRLTGKDKARVAAQLALLRLLDQDPDAAIKALDIDVGHDLPPELMHQRQQLRARAILDLGRPDEALSILANDTSRDADRLRADIYWRGRNWKEASKVFARLAQPVGADGKVDAETEHLVLSWAAALTLGGEQADLAKLLETYGKAMAGTPSAQIFHVIADDISAPTAGDLRQIANQVAQIGELQSFMTSYRQRLAADKLSAIN